jgi:hypothetical protein
VRNIFDQYSQNENRLTHAFASILHHDPKLKSDFLQKFLGLSKTKAKECKISVQAYPDGPPLEPSEVTKKVYQIFGSMTMMAGVPLSNAKSPQI